MGTQSQAVERSSNGCSISVGGIRFFAVSPDCVVTAGINAVARYGEAATSDMVGWAHATR